MESADTVGVLIVLALLYLATLCWGVDSRDGFDSQEWKRRRDWRGSTSGSHQDAGGARNGRA